MAIYVQNIFTIFSRRLFIFYQILKQSHEEQVDFRLLKIFELTPPMSVPVHCSIRQRYLHTTMNNVNALQSASTFILTKLIKAGVAHPLRYSLNIRTTSSLAYAPF